MTFKDIFPGLGTFQVLEFSIKIQDFPGGVGTLAASGHLVH